MRLSYLGKLMLHWCDECHTPVLGKACACGAATRSVPVTPPGDIRPAFASDCKHINKIFEEHFGVPLIPEGHPVVLNKVPDADRMEEVVMGGAVVCAIRYLPDEARWEILPRPAAALYARPVRGYVVIDNGAVEFIRKGASVLAPGLIKVEASVRTGDQVFIFDQDGRCVAVGRAKVDAAEAGTMERGVIVKTRKSSKATCLPGEASWKDVVQANETILQSREAEAIGFVRSVAERNPMPMNVSYSGGKDSLATLLIVHKALGKIPMLFSDTGLEFPETYENVRTVASRYGLELITTGGKENFTSKFAVEGPPSVDFRWCCKACKLQPVKELISERWGECLSFIGQRKYESFARMKSPRVWKNKYVQVQLSAAPIQHWTAMHVFLYLFREEAPYNILYEERIDRIGCFMCPSSDRATFELIKRDYPDLWDSWREALGSWQKEHDLPDEWIEKDLWRKRGDNEEDNSSYT